MSLNVAAVAEAITDTVPAVPFINWQYVYCFIVSLFGQVCATDMVEVPLVEVASVDGVASGAVGASGGFWSWLWPFGGSEAANGATAVADSGGGVAAMLPGPLITAFDAVGSMLSFLWGVFSAVSYTISGLLFTALIAALVMLVLIRVKEWSDYGTLPPRPSGKSYGWSRWQDLLDAAMTTEPKRWREGILAADDMLGELLTRLGYTGKTTADQLRGVPEGAFVTLPQAWEAHRVRNFIAHKKSNFILTQREAFRIMKLYEQVFEEFDFI